MLLPCRRILESLPWDETLTRELKDGYEIALKSTINNQLRNFVLKAVEIFSQMPLFLQTQSFFRFASIIMAQA